MSAKTSSASSASGDHEARGDLRAQLADLEEQNQRLRDAALKMVRSVHSQSFIIPNKGSARDRSVAALDGLLEALGLKYGDLGGLTATEKDIEEGEEGSDE